MMRLILIAVFAAAIGTAHAEPELKGSPEELRQFLHPTENLVTLVGAHEESAYSDKAIFSLVITTEEQRLEDSLEANASLRTAISRSMIDAGIDPDEIHTSKFSTSPQFGWFGDKPKSFEVVNRMSVGISEEAHLQLLARLTDDNDEIVMADMAFEHTAEEEFRRRVRDAALDKALEQQKRYEERLGVKLVPINFSERRIMPRGAQSMMMQAESVSMNRPADAAFSDQAITPPPAQTFDEVIYEATVFVTFKVVQEQD